MGKSARFGLDFLEAQVNKRKKWKKQGVMAGHGGDFDIDGPLKELNRSVDSIMAPPAIDVPNTALVDKSEIPEWIIKILESDSDVARAALDKKVKLDSPHKSRLAQGIRNPDDLKNTRDAEHWLQVRLFYTFEMDFPNEYPFIFAIPNGGHRTPKAARMMRYEGQKKGTPDVFIPLPRGIYHGMFLEVKTEKGSATKEQKEKVEMYRNQGYYCVIAKGYEACMAHFLAYLKLPFFDNKSTVKEIA